MWILSYEVYVQFGKGDAGNEQTTTDVSNVPTVDVYPNPSMEIFNIRMNSASDKLMNIVILDMTGKEIVAFSNLSPGEAFAYNSNTLSAGVYFVQVTQGGFTKVVKVTKLN